MRPRVIIVHGWEGSSEEGWFPWLKLNLEKDSIAVTVPIMPHSKKPTMDVWVNHLKKVVGIPDRKLILVGHSLGCITILRFLETLLPSQQIQSAVLVAGFGRDLEYPGYKGELKSFFQRSLDWKKIKNQCKAFIAIHSDNDQWVPMECNRLFVEKLGAKSIICHNMKHFSGDDGITKLPVVMDLLMSLISSK